MPNDDTDHDLLSEHGIEDLYSPEYLEACAGPGARDERLRELKRRIALDKYRVEPDRLADELLQRLADVPDECFTRDPDRGDLDD